MTEWHNRCSSMKPEMIEAIGRNRKGVRTMAWGIFMTFMTLFGMMALAVREASTSEGTSRTSSDHGAPEGAAHEKPDLPKAA